MWITFTTDLTLEKKKKKKMRNITKSLLLQQFPQLAHIDTLLFLHHSQLFTWMSYDKSCGIRLIENLFVIFLVFELKMGYHSKTNFGIQVHIWRKEKEKEKKRHISIIFCRDGIRALIRIYHVHFFF